MEEVAEAINVDLSDFFAEGRAILAREDPGQIHKVTVQGLTDDDLDSYDF